MEIKAYVCRVIVMDAGIGIFRKLDEISESIPKDGLYGANPMIPNMDIFYHEKEQAQNCANVLSRRGFRAKVVNKPCYFDSMVLEDKFQGEILKRLGADGVHEFVEDVRSVLKTERDNREANYKWQKVSDEKRRLEAKVEELEAKLRISAEKNAELICKYEKKLMEKDKEILSLKHEIEDLMEFEVECEDDRK